MWSQKDFYKSVHSNVAHNSQRLEWPSRPSIGARINKLGHNHIMDKYSTIVSKELLINQHHHGYQKHHNEERILTQKSTWSFRTGKTRLWKKIIKVASFGDRCRVWLWKTMRELSGVMRMLHILRRAWTTQVYAFVKTHQIADLRLIHFIVHNFSLGRVGKEW